MDVVGIGIDLVDIDRVERMLARHGDRLLRKLLTEAERAYVAGFHAPSSPVAARIAAKEAAYKALQSLPEARGVGWRDLEVCRQSDGRPLLRAHGLAAEVMARHGPLQIQLSLTHSHQTAGAVVLLVRG